MCLISSQFFSERQLILPNVPVNDPLGGQPFLAASASEIHSTSLRLAWEPAFGRHLITHRDLGGLGRGDGER